MSQQTFAEMLFSSTASETAATTTAETLMVPSYTFPANYFYQGRTIRFTAHGIVGNVVTAVPTMTFRVRLGTAAALTATQQAVTAAIATNASSNVNLTWRAEWTMVCRANGTGGTCMTTGMFWLPNTTGATGQAALGAPIPASAPATAAVDTTVSNNLGALTIAWSVANAANTIQVIQWQLESLT